MRGVVKVLAAMCVLAYLGGNELVTEHRVVQVPASRVDPAVCQYDGGTSRVTEHPTEPGVYAVTCGDGVVLVAGNR